MGEILAIPKEVKIDPKKLKEMEKVLSQITSDIQILIDTEEPTGLFLLYEQRTLAIKLQRTLGAMQDDRGTRAIGEKIQSFCKGR